MLYKYFKRWTVNIWLRTQVQESQKSTRQGSPWLLHVCRGAAAACHTCQPQESKGQTNICTHLNCLPTVAELSSECPPSFMRPHKLKLPFLALLNRQVPQALPFLQCKEGTWLWYLSASVFLPQALEVSRWFAEPCVCCWLNPWPISSNLLPFPCPGMETTSRPYL